MNKGNGIRVSCVQRISFIRHMPYVLDSSCNLYQVCVPHIPYTPHFLHILWVSCYTCHSIFSMFSRFDTYLTFLFILSFFLCVRCFLYFVHLRISYISHTFHVFTSFVPLLRHFHPSSTLFLNTNISALLPHHFFIILALRLRYSHTTHITQKHNAH